MIKIQTGDKILFNGDSVTDALRNRADMYSLAGYSAYIQQAFDQLCPDKQIVCYNRGCGGDTSAQLFARLEEELKEIRPTVFSLLIGVNDTWRRFDAGQIISAEVYADNLEQIFCLAERYADRIIVMEPFLLDITEEKKAIKRGDMAEFIADLSQKVYMLRAVVRRHGAEYIPLDGIFAAACRHTSPDVYSYDGVHPTATGHALIAKEWLNHIDL